MKAKKVIKSLSVFVLILYIAVTAVLFPANEPVHTPEYSVEQFTNDNFLF